MSNPIISSIAGVLTRFSAKTAGVILRFKPFVLGVGAAGSTYGLTSAYLYNVGFTEGASMEPTIPNSTSWLGVNQTYRKGRGIQIGDCVQIRSPQQPNVIAGKRVVGLPGDYVLRSKEHSPTPGGAPMPGITDWKKRFAIDEVQENGTQVASLQDEEGEEWEEPEMIQVPEGHVWLEGDNLGWSRDSRVYGPVPMALIMGRSSWFRDGLFSWNTLNPGKGLRKVEEWEIDAVLGEGESDAQSEKKR